ncbi:HAD family hydrolase [Actinomadura sp. NPDC023710]|uniref:HAD family hydrolase n=1 Tax=Actinomadura sp. NPDC023710 TaxID=3158219 RepID=UPI0033C75B8A
MAVVQVGCPLCGCRAPHPDGRTLPLHLAQAMTWLLDHYGDAGLGVPAMAEAAQVALVSNTVLDLDRRRALKAAGLDELFASRVYLSHELGLDKAHPDFYPYVLDELDVAPSALLVCGNNIDTDVRAPALLGIRAVLLAPFAEAAHLPPRARLIARIGELPRILTGELRAHA